MRHKRLSRRFSRTSSNRIAMFRNMSVSLFKNKKIITTLQKAKELRRIAERLINIAKVDSQHTRRLVVSRIGNKNDYILNELFHNIATASANRNGGYLRIIKCGYRVGDCAPLAYVELVDS